jgi:hypothetical protein
VTAALWLNHFHGTAAGVVLGIFWLGCALPIIAWSAYEDGLRDGRDSATSDDARPKYRWYELLESIIGGLMLGAPVAGVVFFLALGVDWLLENGWWVVALATVVVVANIASLIQRRRSRQADELVAASDE